MEKRFIHDYHKLNQIKDWINEEYEPEELIYDDVVDLMMFMQVNSRVPAWAIEQAWDKINQ